MFLTYFSIPTLQNCFELYNPSHKGQVIKACKTEADGRVVEGNHVVYRISAPTPEEKEEWIKSIKWVHSYKYLSEMKCKLLFWIRYEENLHFNLFKSSDVAISSGIKDRIFGVMGQAVKSLGP